MKIKKASKRKTAAKAIQYWQIKTGSHDVDYDAVREFIKRENLLDIQPITVDEQIDALLRQAVQHESRITRRGRKVRKFGVPRLFSNGEMITLPPTELEYAAPDIAQTVFDANFDNGVSALKRVAIEEDEYNDYNLFGATLPERDWDLTDVMEDAVSTGVYDDSFDESELDDDDDDDDE
jgi:hypothetical protein